MCYEVNLIKRGAIKIRSSTFSMPHIRPKVRVEIVKVVVAADRAHAEKTWLTLKREHGGIPLSSLGKWGTYSLL